jgi:hypothetical protein
MRRSLSLIPLALSILSEAPVTAAKPMKPISLHPANPHYFLFRRKPTVLVTSGEHYGAVLNLDFDYVRYLDALQADGLNLTRTFSGVYREQPGNFNIKDNTLAPLKGRYIGPWARSETPGYAGGGGKLDLNRWNDAYFRRLKDFVRQAGKRGIVVELVLFCPYYEESMWDVSPLKPSNNVNGTPDIPRTEALTMKHPALVAIQDAMVRKIVHELRGEGNLYYEICNEPYFGGVTDEWQRHIAGTIVEAEAALPEGQRHLIARNISNGSARFENPDPRVSILNFHYSSPPASVAMNYDLNRAIGFDETGFVGTADTRYRTDAWEFLLAGGAIYDHLDYSFTTGHPDGTAPVTDPTPGGGGPALRRQLAILKRFIESFDFLRLRPDPTLVAGGVPEGGAAWALSQPGKAYAVYLKGSPSPALRLRLAPGRYRAEWIDTKTGAVSKAEEITAAGETTLQPPPYTDDIALRIRRSK